MKKLIIASLVIAALAAAGVVSAFSHSYYAGESGEGRRAGCIGDQLTEEQREALSQLMQELKDAGATPEEIREAVQQFLEEQGITTEDCGMKGNGTRRPMGGCFDQLTEEQREALSQLMQELKDAGATPEEIREAVQQFLEEQGIDTEDCQGTMGPKRGQHGN